jgi:choline-glycine betaine transporter
MCVVVGAGLFAVMALLASLFGPEMIGLQVEKNAAGAIEHGSVEMAVFRWMDDHPVWTIVLASLLSAAIISMGACSVVAILRALARRRARNPAPRTPLPS